MTPQSRAYFSLSRGGWMACAAAWSEAFPTRETAEQAASPVLPPHGQELQFAGGGSIAVAVRRIEGPVAK